MHVYGHMYCAEVLELSLATWPASMRRGVVSLGMHVGNPCLHKSMSSSL